METSIETVLGVNIAAGAAYFVLVLSPGTPRFSATAKIVPTPNADHWESLARFSARLVAEARAHAVLTVAFAEPRKFNNWSYNDARTRVELITACALALREAGISVECVSQRTASVVLEVPFDKNVADRLEERYVSNDEDVLHWKDRAPALLVAMSVARKRWP